MFLRCLITSNISMTETMPDVHISSLVGHPKLFPTSIRNGPLFTPKVWGGGWRGELKTFEINFLQSLNHRNKLFARATNQNKFFTIKKFFILPPAK